MANYSFLKEDKFGNREQLTFTGNEMEIYIPTYYFNPAGEQMAIIVGDLVETIGLFWFNTSNKFHELQLPVKIRFEFSERVGRKRLKLQPQLPSIEYDVFKLKRGDAFIHDTNHKQSVDDITYFINKLVVGAKLPPTVPYDEVVPLMMNTLQITEIYGRLGVSATTLEIVLSELYRTRGNLSKPYRMSFRRGKEYDYRMMRITKIPELNSTLSGLMGEDTNHQIASAVVRARTKGTPNRESPMGKLIKY